MRPKWLLSRPQIINQPFFYLILLGILYAVIMGLGIFLLPLSSLDNLSAIEIAREMSLSHNWISPTLNQVIDFSHPPGFYWLTAFSINCFGLSPWALRCLPTFLMFICLCLNYFLLSRFLKRNIVLSSALIFFSSLGITSLILTATPYGLGLSLFSLTLLLGFLSVQKQSTYAPTFFGVTMALTSLLLGLMIGFFLPLSIILMYSLTQQNKGILLKSLSIRGFSLFIVITLPWFYLASKAQPHFLYYYFYQSWQEPLHSGGLPLLKNLGWIASLAFIALLPWSFFTHFWQWLLRDQSFRKSPFHDFFQFITISLALSFLVISLLVSLDSLSYWALALTLFPLSLMIALGFDRYQAPQQINQVKRLMPAVIFPCLFLLIALYAYFAYFGYHNRNLPWGLHNSVAFEPYLFLAFSPYFILGLGLCFGLRQLSMSKWPFLIPSLAGFGLISHLIFLTLFPKLQSNSIASLLPLLKRAPDTAVIAIAGNYDPLLSLILKKSPIVTIGWENIPRYGAYYQPIQNWNVGSLSFWQIMAQNGRPLYLLMPKTGFILNENWENQYQLQPIGETMGYRLLYRPGFLQTSPHIH